MHFNSLADASDQFFIAEACGLTDLITVTEPYDIQNYNRKKPQWSIAAFFSCNLTTQDWVMMFSIPYDIH